MSVEAHHRILADDEVRLRSNAAQCKIEAFFESQLETTASHPFEVGGKLVVTALADAIDAGAGQRQRQRIHHHHLHRRIFRLAKRECQRE